MVRYEPRLLFGCPERASPLFLTERILHRIYSTTTLTEPSSARSLVREETRQGARKVSGEPQPNALCSSNSRAACQPPVASNAKGSGSTHARRLTRLRPNYLIHVPRHSRPTPRGVKHSVQHRIPGRQIQRINTFQRPVPSNCPLRKLSPKK